MFCLHVIFVLLYSYRYPPISLSSVLLFTVAACNAVPVFFFDRYIVKTNKKVRCHIYVKFSFRFFYFYNSFNTFQNIFCSRFYFFYENFHLHRTFFFSFLYYVCYFGTLRYTTCLIYANIYLLRKLYHFSQLTFSSESFGSTTRWINTNH